MSLFPSLNEANNETSKKIEELNTLQQGSLFHTIEYELSDIVKKIKNIDNLKVEEIKGIILRQHSMILNYDLFLMSDETRQDAQLLFKNEKFLRCFLDVIRLLDISHHEKICINKLAYDYYINPYENNPRVSDLLYQLTTEVNGKEVIVLSGILGLRNAQILSMIRNSTFKIEKAVHRVNTFLVKCNIALSISNISSIFCYLFENFTNVFIYTMMEGEYEGLTKDQKYNFDNISIAMLEMLDSLSSDNIRKILYDYAFILSMVKTNTKIRFAIRTAVRYDRIIKIIKSIEIQDNLIIP